MQADTCGAGLRPETVGEQLDRAIEAHNREIARLMAMRDRTPPMILSMPVGELSKLVYPTNPF